MGAGVVDRLVDGWVRPRPVTAAAVLAVAAGGLESVVIGWGEKGFGALFAFVVVVEVTSVFAALVAANGYLRVLRVEQPPGLVRRTLLVTGTAACFGLSLAVAFRDPLWRRLGLGAGVDTLGRLEVVAGAAVAAVVALAVAATRQLGSRD